MKIIEAIWQELRYQFEDTIMDLEYQLIKYFILALFKVASPVSELLTPFITPK